MSGHVLTGSQDPTMDPQAGSEDHCSIYSIWEIPGLGMSGHVLTGSQDPTMDPQLDQWIL